MRSVLETVLERIAYPVFRRVEFRGKRRLRRVLPVPPSGERIVRFAGGFRLELDLAEPLQRDFLAGVYDLHELRIVRRVLREGGDFVDVGAHIGIYAVPAALELDGRGRVLVRPSGTEPLVRVMVEAPTDAECEEICTRLVSVIEQELA